MPIVKVVESWYNINVRTWLVEVQAVHSAEQAAYITYLSPSHECDIGAIMSALLLAWVNLGAQLAGAAFVGIAASDKEESFPSCVTCQNRDRHFSTVVAEKTR
jgi:hypothetical protein